MNNRVGLVCLVLSLLAFGRNQASGSTAVFRLSSPRNGGQVAPGALIPWSITVTLSAGNNARLAFALVDLVQGEGNPGKLDIPPAERVPQGLERFSLPLGISNPGEGGAGSGYTGLSRGLTGAKNLVQIGGAQNTFGKPGEVMGRQTAVLTGLAQGAFRAPQANGVYRFSLANAAANSLLRLDAAKGHWHVEPAAVEVPPKGISFTVNRDARPTFLRGDVNRDNTVDISDASMILGYLFLGSPLRLACEASADSDASGEVLLSDAVYLLN